MNDNISTPSDFRMTADFDRALKLMNERDGHLFIYGDAGTGKSTLLHLFKEQAKSGLVVVAPTGVAAVNVGGQTIHSFFGLPLGIVAKGNVKVNSKRKDILRHISAVVIDEVSMVRADIMDAIDEALQQHCGNRKPFGGIKMILIGDVAQLPPVVRREDDEILKDMGYPSPFFFDSKVITALGENLTRIHLTEIFRQKDPEFVGILNRVRHNKATEQDIAELNKRHGAQPPKDVTAISLTSTNAASDSINNTNLMALKGKSFKAHADVQGDFDLKNAPTDEILELKVGAQVMMIRNDKEKRWVNGTVGLVEKFKGHLLEIRFGEDVYEVDRETWERKQYSYDPSSQSVKSEVLGSFTQYPIKLAWAITIHKSQGRTYDNVIIDLGNGAFAHGQTYVALSRCKTLSGIFLTSKIKSRDIIVEKRVVEFMDGKRDPKVMTRQECDIQNELERQKDGLPI